MQRENKQLKETLLDVQCRSMRNNLIFSGVPENDNSRGCEDTMSTQLNLPTDVVRNATFSRVHRIGKASRNRPRAIIAYFDKFKQKEIMKNMGREFRNTEFGMNDLFPTEINERRKKQYPIMKEKRCLNQLVSMVMDKLYIWQLYRGSRVTPWLF